jgi:phosphogluconate dehydratase
LAELGRDGARPLGEVVDEKAIVNAIVGLIATGGSTNHAIHLPAIARAAGIIVDWEDFAGLSSTVPLIARVYPNGARDVNDFHAAGGMAFVATTLLSEGLIHGDTLTAGADQFSAYTANPVIDGNALVWKPAGDSLDLDMLRPVTEPFLPDGGMKLVQGNLGRAIFKTSSVDAERWTIEAPARCFNDQNEVLEAFKAGELDRDVAVVVRFQGPRSNGMPELHKLTPPLGPLQKKGFRVALVTDGRMSGASGQVPAAIHVSPEVVAGGPLGKVRDGDVIRLDAVAGTLEALVDAGEWRTREVAPLPVAQAEANRHDLGRELLGGMLKNVVSAEEGACTWL